MVYLVLLFRISILSINILEFFFFEFIIITLSLNSVKSIVSISVSFSEKNVFRITMIFNLDLRIPFLSVIS